MEKLLAELKNKAIRADAQVDEGKLKGYSMARMEGLKGYSRGLWEAYHLIVRFNSAEKQD